MRQFNEIELFFNCFIVLPEFSWEIFPFRYKDAVEFLLL
jgi:hypothetical protein